MIQPPTRRGLLVPGGLLVGFCVGMLAAPTVAEEPPVRLAPIKPRNAVAERIDPLRRAGSPRPSETRSTSRWAAMPTISNGRRLSFVG